MTEYVVILAGISLVAIVVLVNFGGQIQTLFGGAGAEVSDLEATVVAELGMAGSRQPGADSDGWSGAAGEAGDSDRGSERSPAARSTDSGIASETTEARTSRAGAGGAGADSSPSEPVALDLLLWGIIALLLITLGAALRGRKREPSK